VYALTDGAGEVVEAYQYDIYGQPRFYDGAGQRIERSRYENVFMFTGRYWEGPLLHLYYYRARYYSPHLGRFTSRDKAFLWSKYAYCGNSPVNAADRSGLLTQEELKQVMEEVRKQHPRLWEIARYFGYRKIIITDLWDLWGLLGYWDVEDRTIYIDEATTPKEAKQALAKALEYIYWKLEHDGLKLGVIGKIDCFRLVKKTIEQCHFREPKRILNVPECQNCLTMLYTYVRECYRGYGTAAHIWCRACMEFYNQCCPRGNIKPADILAYLKKQVAVGGVLDFLLTVFGSLPGKVR